MDKGLEHTSMQVVDFANTARSLGSGDMEVLATPAMVSLMENAAMKAVAGELAEGETTVGSMINTTHIKPSAIGEIVKATATLTAVEGKKLTFHVVAKVGEDVIGEGEHIRYIVNKEKFLAKMNS